MLKNLLKIGLIALLGLVALKVVFGFLGPLVGLLMWRLRVALQGIAITAAARGALDDDVALMQRVTRDLAGKHRGHDLLAAPDVQVADGVREVVLDVHHEQRRPGVVLGHGPSMPGCGACA